VITRADIIRVDVSDDMILRAVEYAEKSLNYTFNRMGKGDPYDRARNIVKGLVMEAAFRQILDYHGVKYELYGHTHWTKKDRYDVGLVGHRYDVKGFHVSDTVKCQAVAADPAWLLGCHALVPVDQVHKKGFNDDDVYVFPFMTGELRKGTQATMFQDHKVEYWLHAFWDYGWTKNAKWKSLGRLQLQNHSNKPLVLRLGGQSVNEELLVEVFELGPGQAILTKTEFFTVLFLQTPSLPAGTVTVVSDPANLKEKISPTAWGNIWIYDPVVFFTGMMSKGPFKRDSEEIPRFAKYVKQYGETKTDNRGMLVSKLNPLQSLLPPNSKRHVPVIHAS
jgi:hypothetical protein